ncbi:hypothetical protein [Luteolibacter sp. Populi]|uniref:hypothetical protein n=1 Tax=Luteolibacter sp. Populi TaxID=3230487 RepID=UPI0034655CA2
MKTRREFGILCLAAMAWASCAPALRAADPGTLPDPKDKPPLLALWVDSHGMRVGATMQKELRFAIWEDGRVLCAKDPEKGGSGLRSGTITAEQVATLKNQVNGSGIFELKGNCYLVPDAPVHCLIASVDGKKQMLYWDEVEMPGYGINTNPKPQHLAFMACWKQVKAAGLRRLKKDLHEVAPSQSFSPPKSWYFKKTIQSE